jgi:hypothetical protein
MIENIGRKKAASAYQPTQDVAELTAIVKKDYGTGNEILTKSWVELNNRSVLDDRDRGQRTFNAFVDESIEDPATAWQWRGRRSKARNKAIQMHAYMTSSYIIPAFIAQNEDDEEDRDFSDAMQDVVEWIIYNSNYRDSFLKVSMGMLVNPVTYMGAEFCEVYQTIKEKTEEGYTKKEVLDEVLSGFNAPIYSADQVLISNAFEQNIQRQRVILKKRYIDYSEAEAKYGKHENFAHVTPGIKAIFGEDGLFYDVKDDDHPNLVEEVIWSNRRDDSEVPFLNGIYMGDSDVDANPIKHRDNRGAPKYNVVPFGYQRINEHFFFFKSLMNAQYWDDQLLDEQYRMGMNRAFLDTNMPVAVTGVDNPDISNLVFPSAVAAFSNPEAKVTPLMPQANLGNLFNAMQITENSIEESSLSATAGGQLPDTGNTATAISVAQKNAETILKGVGANLAISITQYGNLMADIAIQHITAPQVDEILGGEVRLKYRTLTVNDKVVDGKQMSKVLRFDESLLGNEMDEETKNEKSLELLSETGYPKQTKSIYLINPLLFSRLRYLSKVEPAKMFPQSEEYRQAVLSQIYSQFVQNPFISLEALTRKTLYAFFKGETEEIMKDEDEIKQDQEAAQAPQTVMGQQTVNSATANVV